MALVGDAAHPMSPFKGQGANQALCDSVRLVKWLAKAPVASALNCYDREMTTQTSVKVRASREAADFLHSPAAIAPGASRVAGVASGCLGELLGRLEAREIGAGLAEGLSGAVRGVIGELVKERGLEEVSDEVKKGKRKRNEAALPPVTDGGSGADAAAAESGGSGEERAKKEAAAAAVDMAEKAAERA